MRDKRHDADEGKHARGEDEAGVPGRQGGLDDGADASPKKVRRGIEQKAAHQDNKQRLCYPVLTLQRCHEAAQCEQRRGHEVEKKMATLHGETPNVIYEAVLHNNRARLS
jgi:hypothetical protein